MGKARNPLWLIGLANIILNGFGLTAAVPFLLRQAGLLVPQITGITSFVLIPSFCFFLWAPIVEIGLTRRQWWMLLYSIGALCHFLALLQPLPSHLSWFTALLFIANIAMFGAIGILGPLVRDAVPDSLRGKAVGYIEAAVAVSAGGAGLVIWLAQHCSRTVLAFSVAALGLIPVVAMYFIHEPERTPRPRLANQFRAIAVDLGSGLRMRSVREGLVIFLSPMSAAAMTYLFSGIAADYRVGTHTTVLLGAGGWTAANAAGAFLGGRLAGRLGPRLYYPLAGIAAGLCAVAIMLAPIAPATFTLGSLFYAATGGLCGAAALALTIDLTAGAGHAASTWFAAFYAASDLPWTYMQWADGQGYKHFGVRGMLGIDAIGNALPAVLFLLYLRALQSRHRAESTGPTPPRESSPLPPLPALPDA